MGAEPAVVSSLSAMAEAGGAPAFQMGNSTTQTCHIIVANQNPIKSMNVMRAGMVLL